MAVTLTGAGGLFTILGKIFFAQATLNTARGTTVPAEVVDAIDQWQNLTTTIEMEAVIAGLEQSSASWTANGVLMNRLSQFAEDLIVKMVNDDNPQEDGRFTTALFELIRQMNVTSDDVDASTPGITVSATAGNNGDPVVIASVTGPTGVLLEAALAEDIVGTVSSEGVTGSIRWEGEDRTATRLSPDWPTGSRCRRSTPAIRASSSLLSNGGMDTEEDRADTPDDWELVAGTIGTTMVMSNYEVQTLTVAGTPTSGSYWLTYTDVDSNQYMTPPLAYNASGSAVQSALRTIPGLEAVTVSTTGTTPNFVHTVTFEKMHPPGNVGQLVETNNLDTGTITEATTTQATAHVFFDKAVGFASTGSAIDIRQRVTLQPRTVYAFNAWMKVDIFPASGTLTIGLQDGALNYFNDDSGAANSFTVDPRSGGDLSTTDFTAVNGFFRTPEVLPDVVYLNIRTSVVISSGSTVWIDEVSLIAATQLYSGGPYIACFAGKEPLAEDDTWNLAVTNDRAGEIQEWFQRNFNRPDLLLPSDTGGTETIADSLIA